MKKQIITSIIILLLFAVAVTFLAWLLPVRVSIALLALLQLLTMTALGGMLKSKNPENDVKAN